MVAAYLVKLGTHEQPAGRLALRVPATVLSTSEGARIIFPTSFQGHTASCTKPAMVLATS